MKLYNSIIIICSLLIFTTGCNKAKENFVYIKPIISNDTLKHTIIDLPENILYPGQIFICEDKFVIHQHKTDTMFYVFDLNNLKYLYSFGTYGAGPNEFLQINTSNIVKTKNGLKACSLNNTLINIDIEEKNIRKKEKLYADYDLFNGFEIINDSVYLFTNMTDVDYQFLVYNTLDSTTNPVMPYPNWLDIETYKNNHISKIIDCNGYTVTNDNGTKIAMFYGYIDCVRIFDEKWNLFKTCVTGNIENRIPQDYTKKTVYYPIRPQNVKNTIYNIYRGKDSVEDILQIWSWNGELIKSERLGYKITSFCISENKDKMYAIKALNDGLCQLIIYDLKN